MIQIHPDPVQLPHLRRSQPPLNRAPHPLTQRPAAQVGSHGEVHVSKTNQEARLTAHSGRVGLASELTARGASTTEVMLAGNWRTSRMVAHYSAGATAERGAVAKYL